MPYPALSFSQFLARHGNACRLVMGDDGLFSSTVKEKQQAALLLNEACRWAWKWGGNLMLPSLTTSAEVTLTDGVIDRDDVQDSPRINVWATDPEASYETDDGLWQSYLRPAVPCAGGWLVVDGASTMTAYFQKETAQFTGIAWVTATAYVVGDLVYQSGECYKCLTAHTSGSLSAPNNNFAGDLAAGRWRVQQVPDELADALAARMMEGAASDIESRPGKEQIKASKAESLMEDLHIGYLSAKLQPWFLHNGGSPP